MQQLNTKHTKVLDVIGSLNIKKLIRANTIIPIANPINRLGHISPLYATTKCSTDFIKRYPIGIDDNRVNIGYLDSNPHLILPCNCTKVII